MEEPTFVDNVEIKVYKPKSEKEPPLEAELGEVSAIGRVSLEFNKPIMNFTTQSYGKSFKLTYLSGFMSE